MNLLFDSFWRAALYCLHPRVILLSLLPLLLLIGLGVGVGLLFWDGLVQAVWQWLSASAFFSTVLDGLSRIGMGSFRSAVAPLIVVAFMTPLLIIVVMLVVAGLMTPALIELVSLRRFAAMENRCTDSRWITVWVTVSSTALALVLLLLSVPLWFIPPLFFILPPLIWGWLNYRVMSFDALLGHASKEERIALLKQHRTQLLIIGVATGYLGAMPSMIWAIGSMAAVFAVVLLPVAIWLYTLVFAFSTLWFIHYCLGALEQHRRASPLASLKEITHA